MKETPKKNAGKKASEVITKCDKLEEPVAICDQLNNEVEIISIEEIDIAKLIVVVRGLQVLIDRDLAMLYHVETKVLNQKVKRNIARFPERYRFQLTKDEMQELVTICDQFLILGSGPETKFSRHKIRKCFISNKKNPPIQNRRII